MRPRFMLLASAFLVLTTSVFGQSFDEDFNLWPVDLKINGQIIACGGGEVPTSAIGMLASASGKEDAYPVAVVFQGATDLSAKKIEMYLESPERLEQFSVGPQSTGLPTTQIKAIEGADVVWIVAEKQITKDQTKALRSILAASKKMVASGGTLCLAGPSVEYLGKFKTEELAGLTATQESNHLIPDSVIKASYQDADDRKEIVSLLARHPRSVGIGIESNTAMVLRNRKIRVVGEGRVTFCLMANEHKPLRIQHVERAKSRRANPYETIVDLTAWRRDAIERTVEPFPAQEPPVPKVENGTLVIVGGGGMPKGLMERLVEMAGGKDAKLVYVPCSEADEINGPQRTVEAWKKLGVKSATFIHTKDRIKANSDEEFLAPLKDATGIWFGGGRQWNFSDSYYGTKAHKLMKDVLKRGGVIGGSSAGASIQAAYMCRANPVANYDIMAPGYERGLGFIRGVAIDQHFTQRGRQKDMTQLVDRYPQLLGIGLDEATAIIVQKSKAKIVGRGKVHFYNRNEPVISGTDDFLALEDGAVFDLASRKVVEEEEAEIDSDGK